MAPKYEIGQTVRITTANNQRTSPRDADIEPYVGQSGKVTDYYWINPSGSEVFYLYTVQVKAGHKEIVLHEDELEADME
jgi:hypothetical protein